jgi:hypothetical protein
MATTQAVVERSITCPRGADLSEDVHLSIGCVKKRLYATKAENAIVAMVRRLSLCYAAAITLRGVLLRHFS